MHNYDVSGLAGALSAHPAVKTVAELHPKILAGPWAKERKVCHAYKLEIELNGSPVQLYFGVKKSFPLSLPYIFLVQWDSFGILPHVETDGYICYAQEEGSLLDSGNAGGIAQEALDRAIQTIKDGISGANHKDFIDEFGAYWDRLVKIKKYKSLVSPVDHVKRIHLYKEKSGQRYLADDEQSFKKFLHLPAHVSWKHYPALYIPLAPGTLIIPPHPSNFWDIDEIRKIISGNLAPGQYAELQSLLSKPHHEEVILLSLPRLAEGETLISIRFEGVQLEHPLIEGSRVKDIVPLMIVRRDKEYLMPRGGSNLTLRQKRVLLLGCGALGGFIAAELTRAGISRLTVLDKDILTHENIYRHVLGLKHVGKAKVEGIKNDIEGRLPYVEVVPVASTLEDALGSKIKVEDFDLIVSALGNPTVELALNKYVHGTDSPPVIFTWLEPYGIGGHAVLTNMDRSQKGCLCCLYDNTDDGKDKRCRVSFAAPGQNFAKNIDGCRNVFTPFGSLDAVRTAELATRLAIATLTGDIGTNLIRSWKGDATEFLKNGKELSPRYSGSDNHVIEHIEYHHEECPVCHEAN